MQGAAGRLDFVDGQTFGFVNVTVRDNGIPEGEKTFQVRMINQVLPGPFVSFMTVICVRLIPDMCMYLREKRRYLAPLSVL